ncbi:spore coat protein U domain-containing protein [Mixta tenebrionis]|uniref:Spore coat protein U domain-containing protein n=1 Tax=Mixta tenebrionis TaxID=2562439 RepID=A0A506V2T1_9GAMM|nr:spore coat U domain-containing protein [Mixta tenebrionis]TPW39779.1 spore coat protein U domain-containing protein [Mixta tenebrionis]
MKLTPLLCFALLSGGYSGMLQAACALPASSASFGSVTSFTVNAAASTSSTTANVNCGSGSTLALLSNNNITLQLASASGVAGNRGALTRAGDTSGDRIPVQLCTTANCATEMTIGATPITYSSSQLLNLIGLLGGLNFSVPLYLRTLPGQVVAAGNYSLTLNLAVTYRICTGIAALGICLAGQDQNGSGTIPITLSLTITNDCTTITAPNVSFGSAPLVSGFSSVSQSINVVCTKGSSYTVGLSNGSHASGSVRNMANGASLLSYEIYKGSTSNRWGPAGSERQSSANATTVSSDGLTRTFPYTARILTTQNTPPAGNYTDSVVVDLSF